jgi:hypothetical protein
LLEALNKNGTKLFAETNFSPAFFREFFFEASRAFAQLEKKYGS